MKKLLFLVLVGSGVCFAETMTFAEYEAKTENPSYEEYTYLVENPQCYGDSEEEILKLFNGEE